VEKVIHDRKKKSIKRREAQSPTKVKSWLISPEEEKELTVKKKRARKKHSSKERKFKTRLRRPVQSNNEGGTEKSLNFKAKGKVQA